ncbi:restriction endonuclease subunit M [Bifidobacterium margollesii]|uniref:Restriction endonuclease subunit M n=1 Tax=Bifidobacterium margollesii TaxID=2020964 RepID=A0A2N5J798_9BIFI|nr:restriction endonuclease subunit M [Bifidobacterium margollesii]PLS30088.1 restriction endonuclease subunit M [Bifidobacterium margollesii]
MAAQVKSKQRVEEHGEVFTNEREVNAMLDMVKQETERIDSRFLEPACGDGNFLSEVLRRKLAVVTERYGKSQLEYERYTFVAVSSIYGVDILQDNVEECRERLYGIVKNAYEQQFKDDCRPEVLDSIRYLLAKNILCGDALTLTTNNGEPIVFPEWSLVMGSKVKRRDFTFAALLNVSAEAPTFDMLDEIDQDEMGKIIPKPIKEYPMTSFLEVAKYE